jgi:hypothetical protein
VSTVAGATYELRFDFAARTDTTDQTENSIVATADGVTLVSASTTNTNWTTYGKTFITDASTEVSLADVGIPNGLGTIIDNAALCLVQFPDEEEGDEDVYRIQGYVWHDNNRNQVWEGNGTSTDDDRVETSLNGRIVMITNGTTTATTTTDSEGFYFFEVPAGTWTITTIEEARWFATTQESFTVTVPSKVEAPEVSIVTMIKNFLIPTAYAAVLGTFGPYNFGIDRAGGGGGGGSASSDSDPEGEVAGISTTTPIAMPYVLGEQVSVVPTGAPNTGAGGTSLYIIGTFMVVPRRGTIVK